MGCVEGTAGGVPHVQRIGGCYSCKRWPSSNNAGGAEASQTMESKERVGSVGRRFCEGVGVPWTNDKEGLKPSDWCGLGRSVPVWGQH